jgi:uncharacterized protein (TIGR02757 family)
MPLSHKDLLEFLEEKYHQYNNVAFIATDPVEIPHFFTVKEDIEIAGFLTASIAWGTRTSIIRNARLLMQMMENSPHQFLLHSTAKDVQQFQRFYHRTFNGNDCIYFLQSLKNLYLVRGGLESCFVPDPSEGIKRAIHTFRSLFLSMTHEKRVEKHVADPMHGSACKRINMFLRWMVRKDDRGVDFGIWKTVKPADLCCPLDVHTGNVARKLGLISRNQNDWQAVEELTGHLRRFDPSDPVKYDFALFGLGIFEKF